MCELAFGSAEMLKALLAKDFVVTLEQRAASKVGQDHRGISWLVFRKLMRSKAATALNRAEKRALCQWQSGGVITGGRLAEWGYGVPAEALLCQLCHKEEDTVAHRLIGCQHEKVVELRSKLCSGRMLCWASSKSGDWEVTRGWMAPLPIPATEQHDFQWWSLSDECELFSSEDGPVYIDGSCFEGNWVPGAARAGFAALQMNRSKEVVRVIFGSLPAAAPQNSAFAEHYGFAMAVRHTGEGDEIEAIVDCLSVQQYFRRGPAFYTAHKNSMAGLWRQSQVKRCHQITKCKAHCTEEEARANGWPTVWKGNDLVDGFAKQGAMLHRLSEGERNALAKTVGWQQKWLKAGAAIWSLWPTIDASQFLRARKGGPSLEEKVQKSRHRFAWIAEVGHWRCVNCWKVKRTARHNKDGAQCVLAPKWLRGACSSHCVHLARYGCASEPIAFCNLCGAWTESRLRNLGAECKGPRINGKMTAVYRCYRSSIMRGKHPRFRSESIYKPWKVATGPLCPPASAEQGLWGQVAASDSFEEVFDLETSFENALNEESEWACMQEEMSLQEQFEWFE